MSSKPPKEPPVARMMHAFADAPSPLPSAAALVEAHALAFAGASLRALRLVLGRSTIRIGDFGAELPETTRVYFRWKTLKGLAAAAPGVPAVGVEAGSVGGGGSRKRPREVALVELDGEEEDEEGGAAVPDDNDDDDDDGGEVGDGAAPFIADEDADEREQLAALQAQAEEEQAVGGGLAALVSASAVESSAAPSISAAAPAAAPAGAASSRPVLTPSSSSSPALATFYARLAYANARSARMTQEQYKRYARAREAGFVGRAKAASTIRFAAALPPPALSRTTLEILAFLAYVRVADIVEAASRGSNGGVLPLVPPGECAPIIPEAAYVKAIAAQPQLPPELSARLSSLAASAASHAVSVKLREVRDAERAAGVDDRAAAEARAAQWRASGGDAAGDALLLAAVAGAGGGGAGAKSSAPPLARLKRLQ